MIVARTREDIGRAVGVQRSVCLVPTMGALHDGHAALIRRAQREAAGVVVSIFVNPLQFGPTEDFEAYPRTLEADLARCESADVDVVFAPSASTMYPAGRPTVTVDPGPLGGILEGASRPGHFRGVLTVVAKLFALVRPDSAVFGEKDYQQLVLMRQLVRDLSMPVSIFAVETIREPDGLATSSRNRFLSRADREGALSLSRALFAGRENARQGAAAALAAADDVLRRTPAVNVDYLTLRSGDLGTPPAIGDARLLIAARVGTTRLIDNVAVALGDVPR